MYDIFKPEYIWRPRQIWRRLSFKPSAAETSLPLPWNCAIRASSEEVLGRSIATQGVYDLPVTEAITRLTDAGDTTLDVGANIGYMTLVLGLAAGPQGRVICFEPNADVLPNLQTNVANWKCLPVAPMEIQTMALSDRDGEGCLGFPEHYGGNRGIASLEAVRGSVAVRIGRLDSLGFRGAGVMKIDVEGHEASVLSGAHDLLARKAIRDILFEEHEAYPAPSHQVLLKHGYKIFRLTRSMWRPLLLSAEAPPRQAYLPSNFLATIDPPRAEHRFRDWGWRVFQATSARAAARARTRPPAA